MGSLSVWQWLIFIFFIVVLGIPIARILAATDHHVAAATRTHA